MSTHLRERERERESVCPDRVRKNKSTWLWAIFSRCCPWWTVGGCAPLSTDTLPLFHCYPLLAVLSASALPWTCRACSDPEVCSEFVAEKDWSPLQHLSTCPMILYIINGQFNFCLNFKRLDRISTLYFYLFLKKGQLYLEIAHWLQGPFYQR